MILRIAILTSGGDAPGMNAAVETLADGESGTMVGIQGERIERVALGEVVGKERPLDPDLYQMAEVLAGLPE